tara:strand:+ start:1307 stop:2593 length:1287 start_codon:yes stop_codon:yes gene_type:complete
MRTYKDDDLFYDDRNNDSDVYGNPVTLTRDRFNDIMIDTLTRMGDKDPERVVDTGWDGEGFIERTFWDKKYDEMKYLSPRTFLEICNITLKNVTLKHTRSIKEKKRTSIVADYIRELRNHGDDMSDPDFHENPGRLSRDEFDRIMESTLRAMDDKDLERVIGEPEWDEEYERMKHFSYKQFLDICKADVRNYNQSKKEKKHTRTVADILKGSKLKDGTEIMNVLQGYCQVLQRYCRNNGCSDEALINMVSAAVQWAEWKEEGRKDDLAMGLNTILRGIAASVRSYVSNQKKSNRSYYNRELRNQKNSDMKTVNAISLKRTKIVGDSRETTVLERYCKRVGHPKTILRAMTADVERWHEYRAEGRKDETAMKLDKKIGKLKTAIKIEAGYEKGKEDDGTDPYLKETIEERGRQIAELLNQNKSKSIKSK